MKKLLVLFLVSMMAFTACSKKDESATEAKADATAEAKADDVKDPFEGMERTVKAFDGLLKGKTQEEREALYMQAAKHSDPEMRELAYYPTWNFEPEKKDKALAYVELLKGEKDVAVLEAGLRSLQNNLHLDPSIVDFYREAVKHENADVRRAAVMGLLSINNMKKGIDFTADEAVKLLDDKDVKVRKSVCEKLGRAFPDAKMVSVYETLVMGTDDSPADKATVSSCMRGLIYMWYNDKAYVPEAYDLTVKYFEHTPRTEDWPNRFALSAWDLKPPDAWKKIAPDFDGKKLVDAMKSVAKDDNADEDARVRAVGVVGIWGTKADVEELKSIENAEVQGEVVETLKKMN